MTLHVREIPWSESQSWDELVYSSQQGSVVLLHDFLHSWDQSNPTVGLIRLGCYSESNQLVGAQVLMYKKLLFLHFQGNLHSIYGGTPILRDSCEEHKPAQYEILSALAKKSSKLLPYLKLDCNPSLTDIRAYLDQGWEAYPQYTYIWSLEDLDAILKNMHRKSSYVRKAQELYDFECVPGSKIFNEFLTLYEQTVEKYEWKPSKTWKDAFIYRAQWLEGNDSLRAFTCRSKSGDLVGCVLYILSRTNRTAYFWMVGYDHQLNTKEFPPAIHYFAAQCLASEFSYIDFGESNHPSLDAFKDSLGGNVRPFWILKTRNASRWLNYYDSIKRKRDSISMFLQRF
jgi:hypothetical protein